MRIGRAIIIPAILALSVAGSVLTGSEIALAASHTPVVQVHGLPSSVTSGVYYHG